MIRRFFLAVAGLALIGGAVAATAATASASPVNHCPLWANYHLNHPYPHCYANE